MQLSGAAERLTGAAQPIPNAAQLLAIWERGLGRPLPWCALDLLAAVYPDVGRERLAAWSLGRRNAALLQLRAALFGRELALVTACPACGERLESAFDIDDIGVAQPGADGAGATDDSLLIEHDGYRARVRLPASTDLLALAGMAPGGDARAVLLRRCLLAAQDRHGAAVDVDELPAAALAAIEQHMATADPQADVQLALDCAVCRHSWLAAFDIAAFLWRELQAWAQRTLRDVAALARAYGWREADVLALSPTRRQIYLELSQA